jgi:hypothetical protein
LIGIGADDLAMIQLLMQEQGGYYPNQNQASSNRAAARTQPHHSRHATAARSQNDGDDVEAEVNIDVDAEEADTDTVENEDDEAQTQDEEGEFEEEEEDQDPNDPNNPDNWTYEQLLALGAQIGDVKTERWRMRATTVIASLERFTYASITVGPVLL